MLLLSKAQGIVLHVCKKIMLCLTAEKKARVKTACVSARPHPTVLELHGTPSEERRLVLRETCGGTIVRLDGARTRRPARSAHTTLQTKALRSKLCGRTSEWSVCCHVSSKLSYSITSIIVRPCAEMAQETEAYYHTVLVL